MKILYFFALLFCLLLTTQAMFASKTKAYISRADTLSAPSANLSSASFTTVALKDSIVNFGKLFLGTRYRYGSSGTSTFDCSGFTSYVYNNFGFSLPRTSAEQARKCETIKKEELKEGDLVFFQGRRQNGNVGHVGIVVEANENGEFKFIHASSSEGVTITNSDSNYFNKRFVKAGRIYNFDTTLLAVKLKISPEKKPKQNTELATALELTPKTIPAKYHTVKKGENLSVLARKYGLSVTKLKEQNGLKSNIINIKQSLLIEKESVVMLAQSKELVDENLADNATSTRDSALMAKNNPGKQHKVKEGETLYSIAKNYNIELAQLKKLNKIADNKVTVGQNIVLAEPEKKNQEQIEYPATRKLGEQNKQLAQNKAINKDSLLAMEIQMERVETTQTNPTTTDKSNNQAHRVKKGESLYSIARQYDLSVEDLRILNKLKGYSIQTGQTLVVAKMI